MSKSYRKQVRTGICTGSNTEYYASKRKQLRRRAVQDLHKVVMQKNYDDEPKNTNIRGANIKYKDSWNEPTDGTLVITAHNPIASDFYYLTKDNKIKC